MKECDASITSSMTAAPPEAAGGPAFEDVRALGPIDWARWTAAAERLGAVLPANPDRDRRIHHLYLPILFACLAWLTRAQRRPLVVGVQAPQGAGKTTLVAHVVDLLAAFAVRAAAVSIDDFYLTRDQQVALAAAHRDNPYLEHRGYPGTHDIELGVTTIAALRALESGSRSQMARIPVYDKSRHGGRGDRLPESDWRIVQGPLDIVFVEGWMLGYSPVAESALPDRRLAPCNAALHAYARWHDAIDAWVVLRAIDATSVLRWRVQAEEAMRAAGRPGLDRAAIEDYIRRFLPAYQLYGGAPPHVPRDRQLEIWIDDARRAAKTLTLHR
jgi:D-glycerate 3-kinase